MFEIKNCLLKMSIFWMRFEYVLRDNYCLFLSRDVIQIKNILKTTRKELSGKYFITSHFPLFQVMCTVVHVLLKKN